MSRQINENFKHSTRFINQNPTAPFYTDATKYTQFFRERSDLHYHDYPEIGICLDGNGVFFVEDRVYQFWPGTITYIPTGMLHIAQSPSESPSTWRYLWFDEKKLDIWLPEREIMSNDKDLCRLGGMIYSEYRKGDSADITYYNFLVKAFARKVNLSSNTMFTGETLSSRALIMPAVKIIAENFGEDIMCSDLAYACNMSEATFRRSFKSITGEPPLTYLNRIRITMVKSLLENSDFSILDIAIKCGFPVLSTFNRQFMEAVGMTPSQYRKRSRELIKQ